MQSVRKKITVPDLQKMKVEGKKIVVLTAADFMTSCLLEKAGVDVILVGDSLGTTWLGYESTVKVHLREMLHHARAVTRAHPRALVVADLPFGSYQSSVESAVRNAIRLVREGGVDAVKLEGGHVYADRISAISNAGIPVMAHLGLLPQSVLKEGGYRVQGRSQMQASRLKKDAVKVEKAGAFACVLEYVVESVARSISKKMQIPTIGIGSGVHCDGQVLVTSDLLGIQSGLSPKAVRRYANLGEMMEKAFRHYAKDVRLNRFPSKAESFS